jgi:hypothetical protein
VLNVSYEGFGTALPRNSTIESAASPHNLTALEYRLFSKLACQGKRLFPQKPHQNLTRTEYKPNFWGSDYFQ